MKKVNPMTAHLIMRLMSLIKDGSKLTITIPQGHSLDIEILGKVYTDNGVGKVVRMGKVLDKKKKTYSILMEFIVITNRKTKKVLVYPRFFRDGINEIEEESVSIRKEQIQDVNLISQSSQVHFAFTWLSDLRIEGYLVNSIFLPWQSHL